MKIAIYGAGGFGREVSPIAQQVALRANGSEVSDNGEPVVFVSDNPAEHGVRLGLPVVPFEAADEYLFAIAIADAKVRRRLALKVAGRTVQLIASSACIGPGVQIAEGAIFCAHSMVTASATIGHQFHCNIYAYVAHDCIIGDFVTLAPKACVNGNTIIEDDVYIGTGAVLREGSPGRPLRIGRGATVGMGAVVTKDVPAGMTVVGNPARPLIK